MVEPSIKRRGNTSALRRVRKITSVPSTAAVIQNSHIDQIIEDVIQESRIIGNQNSIRILSPEEINANYENAINEAIEEAQQANDLISSQQPLHLPLETVYVNEAEIEESQELNTNEEDPLSSTVITPPQTRPLETDENYWDFIRAITPQVDSTAVPSLDESFIRALDEFLDEYLRTPTVRIETELAEFSRELEQLDSSYINL